MRGTMPVFRRELIENLPIYAEQHRFLPVLALASGARVAEIVVNHRPRMFGQSKYGLGRAGRVAQNRVGQQNQFRVKRGMHQRQTVRPTDRLQMRRAISGHPGIGH